MNKQEKEQTSKFISLILRHKPEVIGIKLDNNGWANVNELIDGINKSGNHNLTMSLLDDIVREDNKQRYKFNEDKTKIRANQGHSIKVDVELQECIPPDVLYHGTGEKYIESILETGLEPRSRLYVHLSKDKDTAYNVGKRHGNPVILNIDAKQMVLDGYKFYLSDNKVWLTKGVPMKYIKMA